MNLIELANQLDVGTAKAFVQAARNVIDAMMIEARRVQQTQTPGTKSYATAELSRAAPPGGWISPTELAATQQRMLEAISAEKWADGFIAAMRVFGKLP